MKARGRKIIALCTCIGLVAFVVAIIGMAGRVYTQVDLRRIEAWRLGADYLGERGVVMQDKHNNCGAAALKMIFECHGYHRPLREIERGLWWTEDGTTMLSLKDLAEASGMHAEGWKFTYEDFAKCPFPAILFVHGNHFVVADSVTAAGVVCMRDPALGNLTIRKENLLKIWNGETLIFRRASSARQAEMQ